MKNWITGMAMMIAAMHATYALAADASPERIPTSTPWAVYYGKGIESSVLDPYDLVVLDEATDLPVKSLRGKGKRVLLYINVGEAEKHRHSFQYLQDRNLTGEKNPNWPDSYYIDLRSGEWAQYIIDEILPDAVHRGFDGVFLDTLDNATASEHKDPKKNAGMMDAAVRIVRAIRENYPYLFIMQNRGYDILPQTAPYIDAVLGESVYATYNFKTKQYEPVADALYNQQVTLLKDAQKLNAKLKVFTLDYADPENKEGIKNIYSIERQNGFSPYVSIISLDKIIAEPVQ